jgi:prepilin-type N-terminal cleavage/methylation domain-containing protein
MKQTANSFGLPSCQRGFTLLELLTSMTLLLIMVGFLAVAFNAASTAWQQGEHDVDRFQQARATLDLMQRDLSQAFVSPTVQFYATANGLAFVAPVNDDPNAADLAEVVYRLERSQAPFRLTRRFTTSANSQWDVYSKPSDWPRTAQTTSTVCDAVINFSVTCFYTNGLFPTPTSYWNSTPTPGVWHEPPLLLIPLITKAGDGMMTDMPPAFINVHLEVVDFRTAALLRAPGMFGTPAYANLTNRATRAFDAYIKIPQR